MRKNTYYVLLCGPRHRAATLIIHGAVFSDKVVSRGDEFEEKQQNLMTQCLCRSDETSQQHTTGKTHYSPVNSFESSTAKLGRLSQSTATSIQVMAIGKPTAA